MSASSATSPTTETVTVRDSPSVPAKLRVPEVTKPRPASTTTRGRSRFANLGAGPLPTFEESEKALIVRALDQTDVNRTHAADLLGLSRRGLLNKIKRYGLE